MRDYLQLSEGWIPLACRSQMFQVLSILCWCNHR